MPELPPFTVPLPVSCPTCPTRGTPVYCSTVCRCPTRATPVYCPKVCPTPATSVYCPKVCPIRATPVYCPKICPTPATPVYCPNICPICISVCPRSYPCLLSKGLSDPSYPSLLSNPSYSSLLSNLSYPSFMSKGLSDPSYPFYCSTPATPVYCPKVCPTPATPVFCIGVCHTSSAFVHSPLSIAFSCLNKNLINGSIQAERVALVSCFCLVRTPSKMSVTTVRVCVDWCKQRYCYYGHST